MSRVLLLVVLLAGCKEKESKPAEPTTKVAPAEPSPDPAPAARKPPPPVQEGSGSGSGSATTKPTPQDNVKKMGLEMSKLPPQEVAIPRKTRPIAK